VLATGAASIPAEKSADASREVSGKRPWWQSFSSLFSLPLVRYGVPALALLLVISIAFIATRQKPESELVAENKERAPVSAVSNQDEEQNHAETPSTATTGAGAAQPSSQNSNANIMGQNSNSAPGRIEQSNAPVAKTNTPTGLADLRPGTESRDTQAAPPIAEGPRPMPTVADSLARTEAAKKPDDTKDLPAGGAGTSLTSTPEAPPPQQNMDEAQEAGAGRAVSSVAANAASQRQARAAREMSRGRDMTGGGTFTIDGEENNKADEKRKTMSKHAEPNAAAMSRRRAGAREDKDARSESETSDADAAGKRSVGGRTFRRQGKAWVDTAYSSSRATVNVSRGSEQYRALVADEPTLRTIAEQLGGEVVVVWKGRAYRIH
jgi:hypothetical protein